MLELNLTVVFLAIMLGIPIWVSRLLANRKTEGPPGLFTGPRRYFYKWSFIYLLVSFFLMIPVGLAFEFYLSFGTFYETHLSVLSHLDNYLFTRPFVTAPIGLSIIFFLSKKMPHQ